MAWGHRRICGKKPEGRQGGREMRRNLGWLAVGLVLFGSGVGLPRKEWNEVKHMTSGTVSRTVLDTTRPIGPVEREITWHAPFVRC